MDVFDFLQQSPVQVFEPVVPVVYLLTDLVPETGQQVGPLLWQALLGILLDVLHSLDVDLRQSQRDSCAILPVVRRIELLPLSAVGSLELQQLLRPVWLFFKRAAVVAQFDAIAVDSVAEPSR